MAVNCSSVNVDNVDTPDLYSYAACGAFEIRAIKQRLAAIKTLYDNADPDLVYAVWPSYKEEVQTASVGQTVFTLTTISYIPSVSTLVVYVDGLRTIKDIDYEETSETEVTFLSAMSGGEKVVFVGADNLNIESTAGSSVTFSSEFSDFSRSMEDKARDTVSVKDFGAVGDGVTDDSSSFALALSSSTYVSIPEGEYKANFTLPSNTVLISNNAKILGSINCTNTQHSSILGTLTIIPPSGATYGMKWRKTRYNFFEDLRIGTTTAADTYDGKGLLIEGGPSAGTYYNTVVKLSVFGMKDVGLYAASDTGDTIFRIGTNTFVSASIEYCGGGVHLLGASNNIFNDLSIEQCTGTILKILQADSNSLSNGNKFLAFYSENPGLSTWIDTEITALGTEITLINAADGTTVPANMRGAAGTVWRSRDSFVLGTSGLSSYGTLSTYTGVSIYGSTSDPYPRSSNTGTLISVGDGTAPADCVIGRQGTGLWGVSVGSLYSLGTWDTGPLRLGTHRIWVEAATGKLRIKNGAPTSDSDGTVVGTQT